MTGGDGHGLSGYALTCTVCGKRSYPTRAEAKTIRKRMPKRGHLNVYRCGDLLAHRHPARPVVTGAIDRSQIRPPSRRRTTPTEGAPPA